jgi:hypothetical protein
MATDISVQPQASNQGGWTMICPYYTRVAFGMYRCMGATIGGMCGHPGRTCPIMPIPKPQEAKQEEKFTDMTVGTSGANR